MKNSWLYIPIETKVRELYGKTLLSCFAATNGFNVVIGPKKDIVAGTPFFPTGTVFNVGLAKNLAKNARRYKRYGHKVVAIDEEGLVTQNDDLYLRHRVSMETLKLTDKFFCWGEKQASLIYNKNKTNCSVFITGNPRFDMFRKEYRFIFNNEAEKIKKQYGKFILINTNFGHANHFSGDDFMFESLRSKGMLDDPLDKNFFQRRVKFQKEICKEFEKIIPRLAEEFKNFMIIIRPHPAESHDIWKKIENRFSNVAVIYSGSVIPWIIASEVLIHNGCTTSIEAFLLEKKAISYRPVTNEELESGLPNKMGIEIFNPADLINTLHQILNNLFAIDKNKIDYLNLYLAGINGKTASESIASILSFDRSPENVKNILAYLKIFSQIKEKVRKIIFHKDISDPYRRHKMSDLSKEELDQIILDFSKIHENFKKIKTRSMGENCYYIYAQ